MLPDDHFESVLNDYERGDLAAAEQSCRDLVARNPGDPEARFLLGMIVLDSGRPAAAAEEFELVVTKLPDHVEAQVALGRALLALGRPAVEPFQIAVRLDPAIRSAIEPLLASALLQAERIDEAIALLVEAERSGRSVDPSLVESVAELAMSRGRVAEAGELLAAAADARPSDLALVNRAGLALISGGRVLEAAELWRRAALGNPGEPRILSNLGAALADLGRPTEALRCFDSALEAGPSAEIEFNRARVLADLWRSDDTIEGYRRALAVDPSHFGAISNLLLELCYRDDIGPDRLLEEHSRIAGGLRSISPEPSSPYRNSARRPVRVGFVSADLRQHAVASFLEPLLEHLDPRMVEAIAISASRIEDEVTRRIRRSFRDWIPIDGAPDEEAAEAVRRLDLDLLIDCSGHTQGNRLGLFARRIAPVQATWLGYPATTGLREIDFRIVDAITDPPGSESHLTEATLRMDAPFLCYRPRAVPPQRVTSPTQAIRFGSFNKLAKISPRCIALWSSVLRAVPSSSMTLKGQLLRFEEVRRRILAAFDHCGVAPDRLILLPATGSIEEHLARYEAIDIALDTFPYHGTTTTCEALWSGIPVVSLAGNDHRSRVGVTLLRACGLDELIASDTDQFIHIAASLAHDPSRLAELQSSVGGRLVASPLCDGASFARRFERSIVEIV